LDFEKDFKNSEAFNPSADLFSALGANVALNSSQAMDADLLHAAIQSKGLKSEFKSTHRLTMTLTSAGPQMMDQVLSQKWHHSKL